jgi:mannitol-specific phosphotransferase system IIBC component
VDGRVDFRAAYLLTYHEDWALDWLRRCLAMLVQCRRVHYPKLKEEHPMKKLLTLLATLAVAMTLSMPVFAQETGSQEAQTSSAPAKKKASKKKASKKQKKSKKQQKSEEGGTGEAQ